jgi:nucleoside triphosphate diphosphatase
LNKMSDELNSGQQKELAKYSIDDLKYLMQRLRDPEFGCPWDLKQNFESIVAHTLEEAYEVADAIERGDRNDMQDELGDLLFQVVFYAQLAQEEGSFDFNDITDGITRKLLRRHPHVFPDKNLRAFHPEGTSFTDDQIKGQWETIKAEERALKASLIPDDEQGEKPKGILDDLPRTLPALNRAEKLQKRAAQKGFEWDDIGPVFEKLQEEIAELKVELEAAGDRSLREPAVHSRLTDEMGDVLFCCVNLARFLKVSPEEALRSTNHKFQTRFEYIEAEVRKQGKRLEDCTLGELDALWNKAK